MTIVRQQMTNLRLLDKPFTPHYLGKRKRLTDVDFEQSGIEQVWTITPPIAAIWNRVFCHANWYSSVMATQMLTALATIRRKMKTEGAEKKGKLKTRFATDGFPHRKIDPIKPCIVFVFTPPPIEDDVQLVKLPYRPVLYSVVIACMVNHPSSHANKDSSPASHIKSAE